MNYIRLQDVLGILLEAKEGRILLGDSAPLWIIRKPLRSLLFPLIASSFTFFTPLLEELLCGVCVCVELSTKHLSIMILLYVMTMLWIWLCLI